MPTAILTSKGQITIPLAVRTSLGLHPGTKLDFSLSEDGFKAVPLRQAPTALKGWFAGRVARPVSLDEMDEAIAAEAAANHDRA